MLISEAHPEDLATFSCSVVDRDASLTFDVEDKVWVTFAGTRIFAGHLKTVEESQLEGMAAFETVDANHTTIMNHPRAQALAISFLRDGVFRYT